MRRPFYDVVHALLRTIYDLRRRTASEESFLRRSLMRFATPGMSLLDIGCGYCRFYTVVTTCGLSYIGVEKNDKIREKNAAAGIECLSSEFDVEKLTGIDVLLFSHIIEHFDFESLVNFVNHYLPKLRVGGVVIILTPVLHRGFYDDFDHVKPYSPAALRQAFIERNPQTQNFGILGEYSERALWMKRDSFWHSFRGDRWMHAIKVPLSLLSTITLGRVGRLTGYGMVLQKLDD